MLNCREVTQQDLLGPVLEVVNLIKVCLYELHKTAQPSTQSRAGAESEAQFAIENTKD